jgi:hypothetical protein
MLPYGSGPVAAPWLHLIAKAGSRAATWLQARGGSLAPPPCRGGLPCRLLHCHLSLRSTPVLTSCMPVWWSKQGVLTLAVGSCKASTAGMAHLSQDVLSQ